MYNGQYAPQQGQTPAPGQYTPPQPQFESPSHFPSQDPTQQYANPYGTPTPAPQDPAGHFQRHEPQYAPTPNPYGPNPLQPQAPQALSGQGGYGQPPQFHQQPAQPQVQTPPLSAAQPSYPSGVGQAAHGRLGPDPHAQVPAWDQAAPQQAQPQLSNLSAGSQQAPGLPRQQSLPQGSPLSQSTLQQSSFNVTTAAPTSSTSPEPTHAKPQQQPSASLPDLARRVSPPIQQQPTTAGYAQPLNSYQPAGPTSQPQQQPEQEHAQPLPQQQTIPRRESSAVAPEPSIISGPPPYPWDPSKKYADPGADAWAQYYAKGGKDPAGQVYFIPSTLPASALSPADAPAPSAQPYGRISEEAQLSQREQKAATGSPQRQGSPVTSAVPGAVHRHSSYSATSSRPQSIATTNLMRKSSYGAQTHSSPGAAGGAPLPTAQYSPISAAQFGAQQPQPSYGEPNYAGRMRPLSSVQSAQHPPFAQYMQPGSPEPGHAGTVGLTQNVGALSLSDGQRQEGEGLV